MQIDDASAPIDDGLLVSIVTTNLMGPIRLTSALIEHLKKQDGAVLIHMSSGLGFVPLALTAVYRPPRRHCTPIHFRSGTG